MDALDLKQKILDLFDLGLSVLKKYYTIAINIKVGS